MSHIARLELKDGTLIEAVYSAQDDTLSICARDPNAEAEKPSVLSLFFGEPLPPESEMQNYDIVRLGGSTIKNRNGQGGRDADKIIWLNAASIRLREARQKLDVSKLWRHYKGDVYEVTGVRFMSGGDMEGEVFVDYRYVPEKLEQRAIMVPLSRPFPEWEEIVTAGTDEDPVTTPRFVPVYEVKRLETEAEIAERGSGFRRN